MKLQEFFSDAKGISKVFVSDLNDDINIYWRWNKQKAKTISYASIGLLGMALGMYALSYFHLGAFP